MCFQIDGKYPQAAKCVKSRIMTKLIDCVLSIETFEHQCVMLKGMLQSTHLKYHMKTIGIDQSLSNSILFLNTDLLKTSINYTNVLGSAMNNKNSNIFLRPIWFILLKDSPITVPDIP